MSENKEEEAQPDWLAETLKDASERQEISPSMTPPPVSQAENDYINISDEERKRKEKVMDLLIIFVIFILFCGLLYVLFTE